MKNNTKLYCVSAIAYGVEIDIRILPLYEARKEAKIISKSMRYAYIEPLKPNNVFGIEKYVQGKFTEKIHIK